MPSIQWRDISACTDAACDTHSTLTARWALTVTRRSHARTRAGSVQVSGTGSRPRAESCWAAKDETRTQLFPLGRCLCCSLVTHRFVSSIKCAIFIDCVCVTTEFNGASMVLPSLFRKSMDTHCIQYHALIDCSFEFLFIG